MESTNPNMLFAEYTKMLGQFKLPGIDIGALMETQRKDIEALATANSTAIAGVQALGQKQAEILRETMAGVQTLPTQVASRSTEPGGQTGELVQQAMHKALADMQDLAETAYRAQSESIAVVTKRAAEHVEELKALLQQKK
jgi:phasin family protein